MRDLKEHTDQPIVISTAVYHVLESTKSMAAAQLRFGMLVAAVCFLSVGASGAETLSSSLVQTLQSNPQLLAARAEVRAISHEVDIARGGYRPQIAIDTSATTSDVDGEPIAQGGIGLQLDQPLYDGARTSSAVRVADARLRAAQSALDATTQTVLLSAVSAYANVQRQSETQSVRSANLKFLESQVQLETSRLSLGESTMTILAQAQAERAGALAQLAAARAEHDAAKATYNEIVGRTPSELLPVDLPLTLLPVSLETAQEMAEQNHPAVQVGVESVQAAEHNLALSRAAARPSLGLQGRIEHVIDDLPRNDLRHQDGTNASLSLQLTIPLYQAGQVSARLRQSQELLEQQRQNVLSTRFSVESSSVSAWHRLQAARLAISASDTRIAATQLVRAGKVDEQDVGLATTQGVLFAQQEVLEAQLDAAELSHDALIAAYTLLAAVGRLNPDALALEGGS